MIPAGPINGEYVAILILFLIGLPAVSVFNSEGEGFYMSKMNQFAFCNIKFSGAGDS